jgi:hypothetical protein
VARLTSCDGLPFSVFITSPDLRRLIVSDLLKSANSIAGMVVNQGTAIRASIASELVTLKETGSRFCVMLDEWTSMRNRSYMNVNVHAENCKFWNLGLVTVLGSTPAEKCVELLNNKLRDFGLKLESDIVCICTDGARVMTKVGELISAEQQLCYAHGIHLAVTDVL